MKKLIYGLLTILLLSMLLGACAAQPSMIQPASTQVPVPKPSTTQPTAPPSSTIPASSPKPSITQSSTPSPSAPVISGKQEYGGILKIIARPILNFGASAEVTAGIDTPAMVPWDPLVRFDKTGAPIPSLTASWNIAPDGKSITLNLRKGVKFQDGTDFNAAAVKYHIENMKFNRAKFALITSMDVLDDYTIRLNLSKFDSSLMTSLALSYGRAGSPTALQKPTTPQNQFKDHVVGTGPFSYVDYQKDVSLKYTKFANYWQNGKPYLDALEFVFVSDPNTASMAFQSGQGQVLRDVDAVTAATLKSKGYNIIFCDYYSQVLAPNSVSKDSPFADVKVRQAVEYALDRTALAKVFGGEYSQALKQICPPSITNGYNPSIQARQYDPAKAKQLLAEAGYSTGFKTKLIMQTSDPKNVLVGVQDYLRAVGIDAELDVADAGRFNSYRQNGWDGLRYEQCGLDQNYAMTVGVFWNQGTYYFTSVARPTGFQDTIDKVFYEPDFNIRQNLIQSLTKTVSDQAMVTPLWTRPLIVATTDKVHDTGLAEYSGLIWYPENAWLNK
jgi:peptide/nickel transport system substrate-binding protein